LTAASLLSLSFAHADPADDSLRITWQEPPQWWGPGRGVYLGKGLVLTAAHVVGSAAHTKPRVHIAGAELPATAIREGNVERVDLTLLSVDEQKLLVYLRMRRMPLCDNKPWPGEAVIVAIPEGTARSHIMLPSSLPAQYQKRFSTVISDVATNHRGSRIIGSPLETADQKRRAVRFAGIPALESCGPRCVVVGDPSPC
jgi:hypothetical protein